VKRRWSVWPKRAAAELNGVGGVASVGGAALGFAGWSLLAGSGAAALSGIGAVITVGAFGYALYRSVPPKLTPVEAMVGKVIPLEDLEKISPTVLRLAVIGPSMVGKTTLKDHITFSPTAAVRTQQVTAHICNLQTAPVAYIAILDGGGEKFAQQFMLAEVCDCLCIIIDHNSSDADAIVDDRRLSEHTYFMNQVRLYLDEKKIGPKKWIRILINKRDLWARASQIDRDKLLRFYEREVQQWKLGNRSSTIEARPHSNSERLDVAEIVELIKRTLT
jgi:hypothetical protein